MQTATSLEAFAPIPDIELPNAPRVRAEPTATSARPAKVSIDIGRTRARDQAARGVDTPGTSTLPGLFDDDEHVALELENAPLKRRSNPQQATVAPAPALSGTGGQSVSRPAQRSSPSLRPPPPSEPETSTLAEDREAQRLGNYGPSPQYIWESPLYAWRVQARHRELRAQIASTKKAAKEADEQLEAQLLDAVEYYRAALDADAQASRILASYKAILDELRKQGRMLSETLNRRAESFSRHDNEISSLERGVSQLRASIEQKKQDTAALYAASRSSGGASQEALEQGRKELAQTEQREQDALARITELRRNRKTVEQESLRMQAEIEQDLEKARAALKGPLKEIGPGLFALDLQLPQGAWGKVMAAKKAADDTHARAALLERAQKAFDRPKVAEGVGVVAGTIALFVLLIMLGVIRMEPPELAPAPPSSTSSQK